MPTLGQDLTPAPTLARHQKEVQSALLTSPGLRYQSIRIWEESLLNEPRMSPEWLICSKVNSAGVLCWNISRFSANDWVVVPLGSPQPWSFEGGLRSERSLYQTDMSPTTSLWNNESQYCRSWERPGKQGPCARLPGSQSLTFFWFGGRWQTNKQQKQNKTKQNNNKTIKNKVLTATKPNMNLVKQTKQAHTYASTDMFPFLFIMTYLQEIFFKVIQSGGKKSAHTSPN